MESQTQDPRKLEEIAFVLIVLPRQSSCGGTFCYGNLFIFCSSALPLYHLPVLIIAVLPAPKHLQAQRIHSVFVEYKYSQAYKQVQR